MAQKLIKCLEQPFHIDNQQLFITASIGISIYPEDGNDAETLLRNADAAMYKAKREGRNTFQYYTKDMTDRAFQRVSMETALRHGIENQEFVLNYQPQFDLATGQIIGIEALIRWLHPVRGTVSPMQFIPVAEDTGLIIPLGDWILHEASRQIREWHEAGLTDVRVAVNISGKQLRHNQLLDTIESILSRTGCNPEWLELEITEGFIMEHADQSISLLNEIRKIGIELAIDDFGTGYSSLAYLKQLPLNKLKIDKSFVRDIPADADDMAITRAVIALGKSLNLTVIAEGVETETQKSFLENEGCHQVQGYLYSKPLGAVQTTQFLKEYQLRKAITV
jgi:EAL domain-containing protein (putative c-di-GMP-specific phosphodiesterase class I)